MLCYWYEYVLAEQREHQNRSAASGVGSRKYVGTIARAMKTSPRLEPAKSRQALASSQLEDRTFCLAPLTLDSSRFKEDSTRNFYCRTKRYGIRTNRTWNGFEHLLLKISNKKRTSGDDLKSSIGQRRMNTEVWKRRYARVELGKKGGPF